MLIKVHYKERVLWEEGVSGKRGKDVVDAKGMGGGCWRSVSEEGVARRNKRRIGLILEF